MSCWVGCTTGTLKPLSYQQHMAIQLILWGYDPWALKCSEFASLDQQELFNVTSNALSNTVSNTGSTDGESELTYKHRKNDKCQYDIVRPIGAVLV